MDSKSMGLTDLYENDPWVRGFMEEVYDIFGLPKCTDRCIGTTDRILYVWGMMSLVHEMKRNEAWKSYKETMAPEEAALAFIRLHYEETGRLLMESHYRDEVGVRSEDM